jgi:glutamate racemase
MDLLSSTICSILATRNSAFKKAYKKGESMKASQSMSRTAHFIDIENLCESRVLNEELVREVKKDYFEITQPMKGDQFVIGVSHINLSAASFGWGAGRAQFVVQSGQDGADLALIGVIQDRQFTDRFKDVAIASGDGIFAEMAMSLRRRSQTVRFIARENCISQCIFRIGCECLLLPTLNGFAEEYQLVS